jgi:hypothetical protein
MGDPQVTVVVSIPSHALILEHFRKPPNKDKTKSWEYVIPQNRDRHEYVNSHNSYDGYSQLLTN